MGQGEVPHVQCDRHLGRETVGLQSQRGLVIARLCILGHMNENPDRLVMPRSDVDRIRERRQGVGPVVANAGRVARMVDEMVIGTQHLDLPGTDDTVAAALAKRRDRCRKPLQSRLWTKDHLKGFAVVPRRAHGGCFAGHGW